MGMFASAVLRSKTGRAREEDYSLIYYNDEGRVAKLYEETYKNYSYSIETAGSFPVVTINATGSVIPFELINSINLADRNKMLKEIKVCRFEYISPRTEIFHSYREYGDHIYNVSSGHRYTINELKADARAYIDALIEEEADYAKNGKDICKWLPKK